MSVNKKIGFIGAGKMAGAIINGLIKSEFTTKENILATEINQELADKASQLLGIKVITDNIELVKSCDVIVLSVKPFIIKDVLNQIKNYITRDKLIISIAAGIGTESMEQILQNDIPVIRVMPNTPALVNEGMSAVCKGKYATDEQINFTKELFSKTGRCIEISEKLIDAVTGISGSGPAFFYLMIEAMADGGVKLGIPKATALELAAQTAIGAAKMILETGKHPSALKDEVTTPGGCTAAGLAVMEDMGVRSALINTVEATAKSASGLGN